MKMIQFNLRIQPDLRDKISAFAVQNHRSDNAEAIYRLQQSFFVDELVELKDPSQVKIPNFECSLRKFEVAERLHIVLQELHKREEYHDINFAEFAYILKMERVGEVEMWFEARLEPPFKMLEHIAETFGINKMWLLWGKGTMK